MRVLWVCNQCIPAIANNLNMNIGNKEGWLTGLSERLLLEKEKDFKLAVCFPVSEGLKDYREEFEVTAYGYYEDRTNFEKYNPELEKRFEAIIKDFKPDVIHVFGTEYGHTLAVCRACRERTRLLIGIQGLCSVYAQHYLDGLPEKIVNKGTLRDKLKKDNIRAQQEKFVQRGKNEIEALSLAGNITGRTDWDKFYTNKYAPMAEYYFMNETLRSSFYEGCWSFDDCEKHSIFVSQGDYPIKGLHVLLEAMPGIIEKYPDTKVYVAGNKITGEESFKKKLLIGSYGKYILELIEKYNLSDRIEFLGSLDAQAMKERYLKSNVFVSPSLMENSPNSVGEAMLLSVPVVSSDVGGVRNLMNEDEGYVFTSLDINGLTEAVCKVFEQNGSALQKEMCEKASAHARKTHNADDNFRRLKEIYGEIAKQ